MKLIGAGAENTTLKGNNTFTIITCTASGATSADTVLKGFTVTNGKGNQGGDYGGGMYINGASPTVTDCTFAGNQANSGGGMYIFGGSPTVTNCVFSGNTATDSGGGMYVYAASPVVVNTILWGNTAGSNAAADGPDIYNNDGTMTLKNCALPAAGVYSRIGTVTSENCDTVDPLLVSCDAAGNEGNGIASTDIRFYRPGRNIGRGLPVGTVVSGDVKVPATDQRGRSRPGADGLVDIGAVEHDGVAPTPPSPPTPSTGPSSDPSTTPTDQSGATVTPVSGGTVSGDRLLVKIPAGGSAVVTLRVTDWKDRNGNPVTPYEVRVYVDGRRRESRQDAETVVLTLTPADAGRLVEVLGHIAGDQWISSQAFTVTQSSAVSPSPTPAPDPAGPSDPTPTPTPDPTPADPTTPDSGGSSGGSGGGCQAMGFPQGLLALAALALLRRK